MSEKIFETAGEAAALIRNSIISPKSERVLEVLDAKRARCGDAAGDALTLFFAALTSIIACMDTTDGTFPRDIALMSLYHLAKEQGVTAEDSNALHMAFTQDGEDALEWRGR